MRNLFGFLLVLIAATLVDLWATSAFVGGKSKTISGELIKLALTTAILASLLHFLASKLKPLRWTRFVPYAILCGFSAMLGLQNHAHLLAALVPGMMAVVFWKFPAEQASPASAARAGSSGV